MAQFTARDLFADWYKSADISMDENILKLRLAGIDKAIKKDEDNFWLELVRIYLQLPAKDEDQKKSFISLFKEADPTFPLENNEAILKILATSTLCINITEQDDNNNVICLAVLIGNFFSRHAINQKIPILRYAHEFIQKGIKSKREDELDGSLLESIVENNDGETKSFSNDDIYNVFATAHNLLQSHLNLKDEVNVLWWLLGEFSNTSQKSFKKTGAASMALIAPFELASQTGPSFGFTSADAFLNRALTIANNGKSFKGEVSISGLIESVSIDERKMLTQNENISDFTPGLLAIKKSIGSDGGKGWAQENQAYLDKKFKPIELANQIYNEYLFVNTL